MDYGQDLFPLLEHLSRLLRSGDDQAVQRRILELHPADIADLLDELPLDDSVTVFDLLPLDVASEVLDETGSRVRQELVEKVSEPLIIG